MTCPYRPLKGKVIVKRYEMPEKHGSLWLPDVWRVRNDGDLWELEAYGPDLLEQIGAPINTEKYGYILHTPPFSGVQLDEDYWCILTKQVKGVTPWELQDEEE